MTSTAASIAPAPDPTARPAGASSPPEKHFAALDGLRGVAILLVLAEHYRVILRGEGWERWVAAVCANGFLGVDLFFVLSGFLITRILVGTRDGEGYFRIFYARRAIRIFPLYYAFLAGMFLVVYPTLSARWHAQLYRPGSALYYLGYLANHRSYATEVDVGLVHLWSLSVEEQFYLVWPLLVYFTPRRWLIPLCGLGFALAVGCRAGMTWAGFASDVTGKVTACRLDSLLIGAAVGIVELNVAARARLMRWNPLAAGLALVPLVALLATGGFDRERDVFMIWGYSAVALFFATVVFWTVTAGDRNAVLLSRPLRALGKYSYAIYLLHLTPMLVMPQLVGSSTSAQRVAQIAANLVAVLIMARVSWVVLEAPCLRLKRYFPYHSRAPILNPLP